MHSRSVSYLCSTLAVVCLPAASKKWVWASKISEQLATGLVEVEQVLERQIKGKKSVSVDHNREK